MCFYQNTFVFRSNTFLCVLIPQCYRTDTLFGLVVNGIDLDYGSVLSGWFIKKNVKALGKEKLLSKVKQRKCNFFSERN